MTHYFDNPSYSVNISVQQVVRDLWVKALRSGQYEQGRQYLKTADGGYCCLGVLCNLVAPGDWGERAEPYMSGTGFYPYTLAAPKRVFHSHRGSSSYPERGILDLAGITELQANYLAHRNDVDGWTFGRIADEVERGFPGMGPNGRTVEHIAEQAEFKQALQASAQQEASPF